MSEPVSNVEIEDVLSSIRRLVSEDVRPKPAPHKPVAPQRLVLTPAQRVTEDHPVEEEPVLLTEPAFPEPDAAAQADAPDRPVAVTEDESQQDAADIASQSEQDHSVVAEMPEIAVDNQTGESDDSLAEMVEREVSNALREILPPTDAPDEGAKQPDETAQGPQEAPVSLDIADEPAVDIVEETPPEEASEDLAAQPEPQEQVTEEVPTPELSDESAEHADEPELPEEAPHPTATEAAQTLETKIAALEQMIGQGAVGWDEDTSEDAQDNAPFDTAMAWQDHVAEEPNSPLSESDDNVVRSTAWREPQFQHRDLSDTPPPMPDDAPMIDEDMLRDMVADIVRQELQGALGERITRNVRKLVRREIHRALLSQEFE